MMAAVAEDITTEATIVIIEMDTAEGETGDKSKDEVTVTSVEWWI